MIAAFLQLPGFPRSTEESAFSLYFRNKKCMQVKSVSRLCHHHPALLIAHHSPRHRALSLSLTPAPPAGSPGPPLAEGAAEAAARARSVTGQQTRELAPPDLEVLLFIAILVWGRQVGQF